MFWSFGWPVPSQKPGVWWVLTLSLNRMNFQRKTLSKTAPPNMNNLYVCKWLEYDERFDKIDFVIRIPVDFMALFEHRLRVRSFPCDLVESKIWANVTVSCFSILWRGVLMRQWQNETQKTAYAARQISLRQRKNCLRDICVHESLQFLNSFQKILTINKCYRKKSLRRFCTPSPSLHKRGSVRNDGTIFVLPAIVFLSSYNAGLLLAIGRQRWLESDKSSWRHRQTRQPCLSSEL